MLTDNVKHEKVLPPIDLTRVFKSCHKRKLKKQIPGKIGASYRYHVK